jgi:hypothetical protein
MTTDGAADPEFICVQRAFARHLRAPQSYPEPPGHAARRLDIYRYAVYANVERFMRDNYPRLRAIMAADEWEALVRDYLARHVARASAFVDLPREFLLYLESGAWSAPTRPYLAELAHFDWLETALGADLRCIDITAIDRDGDLLRQVPVANPIMVLTTYRFPVHAISVDYQPQTAPIEPTRIAAYRGLDHEFAFLDLNAASARLLELVIANGGRTGGELIETIAAELGRADLSALREAGSTIFSRMRARDAILGTRSA